MTLPSAFSPSPFVLTPNSKQFCCHCRSDRKTFRSTKNVHASNIGNTTETASYETGKIKTNIRVFLDKAFILGETLAIDLLELRHLRARRARDGDTLLLFNKAGNTATAVLQGSDATILEVCRAGLRRPSVAAIIGFPKNSGRTDWIVEKLTELGVTSISFSCTARSLGRPTQAKIQRWHRLAAAAAKQSLRTEVPHIDVLPFDRVLDEVERHAAPILLSSGGLSILSEACSAPVKNSSSALLLIGPEGGFHEAEIDALVRAGAVKVGLGDLRLRVDTAAVVAAGMICQLLIHGRSSDKEAG